LPGGWVSIDLPGYRERPEPSTYAEFSFEGLPPLPGRLDCELPGCSHPAVEESLAGGHADDGDPTRPATGRGLDELVAAIDARLPRAFETFVCTPEPR
jgi:hypothetical protein